MDEYWHTGRTHVHFILRKVCLRLSDLSVLLILALRQHEAGSLLQDKRLLYIKRFALNFIYCRTEVPELRFFLLTIQMTLEE